MRAAAVESVAMNAHQGLYLVPDMYVAAAYVVHEPLTKIVAAMHETQTTNDDFDWFADYTNDVYLEANTFESVDLVFSQLMMAAGDLSATYRQIHRGLKAATDLALAIFVRSNNIPTEQIEAKRVVPPSLDDLQISKIDAITTDTFLRILNVEPWKSWLPRLRAQKQRTQKTCARLPLETLPKLWEPYVIEETEARRKTIFKKSCRRQMRHTQHVIRRSSDMFQRFLSKDILNKFLHSSIQNPLFLEGHLYNYQVIKHPDSLYEKTRIIDDKVAQFSTSVLNKKNEVLCEVCVYFDGLPLLDAIAAFIMHIRNAELEMRVLERMCVLESSAAFYEDKYLPELKGLIDPTATPTLVNHVMRYARSFPELRKAFHRQFLKHAYSAFQEINQYGRNYLHTMRICGKANFWEYINGTGNSFENCDLMQRQIEHSFKLDIPT